MHSVNRANFAILHWFGLNLAPRFTNLQAQLKHLYCGRDVAEYRDCLIQPSGAAQEDFPGGVAACSLPGHYLFRDYRHSIDLEAILTHAGFD